MTEPNTNITARNTRPATSGSQTNATIYSGGVERLGGIEEEPVLVLGDVAVLQGVVMLGHFPNGGGEPQPLVVVALRHRLAPQPSARRGSRPVLPTMR